MKISNVQKSLLRLFIRRAFLAKFQLCCLYSETFFFFFKLGLQFFSTHHSSHKKTLCPQIDKKLNLWFFDVWWEKKFFWIRESEARKIEWMFRFHFLFSFFATLEFFNSIVVSHKTYFLFCWHYQKTRVIKININLCFVKCIFRKF